MSSAAQLAGDDV